jgi:opacity protein-like surface antigen
MKKILFASLLTALFSSQALAKDVVASSYCPMTGAKGIGRGASFEVAVDLAIKACIAKGGVSACCYKFTRKVS